MRFATLPSIRALAAIGFSLVLRSGNAGAQGTDSSAAPRRPDADAVCLGFAFGPFTPKLDWEKAGHRPVRDSSALQHAPAGRDWAADIATRRDSVLYLFPAWWPVGVLVEVPNRAPAYGDTVSGRATALVARGDLEPPVAKVRAWRVPCAGGPRPAAAPAAKPAEKNSPNLPPKTGTRPVESGILRRSP
ncbi:MAG: hypothetical protein HOQ11_09160 [Gemmatimonadaceae bacterium]|nr:hypothetical protein [Gemmatimonadaceae bacterium]